MTLAIGTNFGLTQTNVAELNRMSARAHNLDASVPLNVIPKRYSIDHEIAANIDKMCQASRR